METLTLEPEMRTLVSCLNKLLRLGYTDNYNVDEAGLKCLETGKIYTPAEIQINNFYRFEGTSDPGDESILYAIETSDGRKGTLVDAYGPSSDTHVTAFMHKVEEINKKV